MNLESTLQPLIHQATAPFVPQPFLRSGDLQTLLARYQPKAFRALDVDTPFLVDGGVDATNAATRVRLLAYYTPSLTEERRGLVLLLHGWEGCSHSNYNLLLTITLARRGYDVVRLNLRDHGPNLHVDRHALNPGIFLGILLAEVLAATQQIALFAQGLPFSLIGVSMGGNFALRLGLAHQQQPIPNLAKVVAINPAIDPAHATDRIDSHPLYRRYFRRRWLSSLLAKAAYFPTLYDFAPVVRYRTVRAMTEWLIQTYGQRYGAFRSADEYFAAYTVTPTAMQALTVPTAIISSTDDPVIAAADFYALPSHPLLDVQLHPSGGHVGYVDLFPLRHHLPQLVLSALGIE